MSKALDKLEKYLKDHKDEHYNFETIVTYTISSGSLELDEALDGGFGPGLHRFIGPNETGKTSEALEVLRNFLAAHPEKGRGVYFSTEGRLTDNIKKRCGLKFVDNPKEWGPNTCFVLHSNIYEAIAQFLVDFVIDKTDDNLIYCFILDSLDGLIRKEDVKKPFEESGKVAGGALVSSTLWKKIGVPLSVKGHMAIFISQWRSKIDINRKSSEPYTQIAGSGGHALKHYPNYVLEFLPKIKSENFLLHPETTESDTNPAIGHTVRIIFRKSPNEKTGLKVKYPVKYGQKGGSSIWVIREVFDALVKGGFITKRGAWYYIDDSISQLQNMKDLGIGPDTKFQGKLAIMEFVETNYEAFLSLFESFR